MSLFKEYIKEKNNYETLENQDYFFTYYINEVGSYLFITEMFIKKDKRNFKTYRDMINDIFLKAENVNFIIGKLEKNMTNYRSVLNMHYKTGLKDYYEDDCEHYLYIEKENLKKFMR